MNGEYLFLATEVNSGWYRFLAMDQRTSRPEVRRDASRGTSVRGRRYPLIIFASGVKDLDRPGRALSSLYRSVCEAGLRLPFSVS